jgi:hypothetical protein
MNSIQTLALQAVMNHEVESEAKMKLEDWKMQWIGSHPENATHILDIFKSKEEREWEEVPHTMVEPLEGTETEDVIESLRNLGFAFESS